MLSLVGSAGLATAGPAQAGPAQAAAVDEAAVLARIHALQAQPDAAQADWLRGWLDYRSRARRPLEEARTDIDLPRYPIAAAARAALQQLAIAEQLAQWQRQPPAALPQGALAPAQRAAWRQWLAATPTLPAAVTAASPQAVDDEALLQAIAAHPLADPAWTEALAGRAQLAASLRWLAAQAPTLAPRTLATMQNNPAAAAIAWREWARRADAGAREAASRLHAALAAGALQPGLVAGLSAWQGLDEAPLRKADTPLARALALQRGQLPRSALYAAPQP